MAANEKVPTPHKISGFMKRRGISLQVVRDTKAKTVAERIEKVRDQLCRYDDHQRRVARDPETMCPVYGRTPPDLHWAMDEYCIAMSVDTRRSYSDKGSDENHVKSLDTCRELSGIGLFNLGLIDQPYYTYAIIPLTCKYTKVDGKVIYNVREAKNKNIRAEAERYPENVRVYYWPSGMCREPVFDAFIEDFIKDCRILELPGDKLLSMD